MMKEYPTFSLPQLIDLPMSLTIVFLVTLIIFLLFFLFWERTKKIIFPTLAGIATLVAIVAVVLLATVGQSNNDNALNSAIEKDYGVTVSSMLPTKSRLVIANGEMYECTINSQDRVQYYVLCTVDGKPNILLNTVTNA